MDLATSSAQIEATHDEFEKYAYDLPIFTFYETIKTNIGISVIIVSKESALLGMWY